MYVNMTHLMTLFVFFAAFLLITVLASQNYKLRRIAEAAERQATASEQMAAAMSRLAEIEMPAMDAALVEIACAIDEAANPVPIVLGPDHQN